MTTTKISSERQLPNGYPKAMPEENESETHDIWGEAKRVAKDQLGEAAISEMPPAAFLSMNPYAEGSWQHQEWESAHEHWIMTGLGY